MPFGILFEWLNSKQGFIPEFEGNIDTEPGAKIYVATVLASGTLPSIGGNRFLIIQDVREQNGSIIFGVQMAIGFGSASIAIRHHPYGASSEWLAWIIK